MNDTETNRRMLYAQGCNDREIADKLGLTRNIVMHWRVARDLPSNYRTGKISPPPSPRVRIGDRITFTPTAFVTKGDCLRDGTILPGKVTGKVTWIHPRRRYYLVEAELFGMVLRECFPIADRR